MIAQFLNAGRYNSSKIYILEDLEGSNSSVETMATLRYYTQLSVIQGKAYHLFTKSFQGFDRNFVIAQEESSKVKFSIGNDGRILWHF